MDSYKIIWTNNLSVGNEHVDSEHKKLIELIASISEHDRPGDESILSEALGYATSHFANEEAFMAKINYPGLEEHQKQHKYLTRTLLAYKKEYENGTKDLYSFKNFMFRWVRDHIMDEDKKIGLYLKSLNEEKSG